MVKRKKSAAEKAVAKKDPGKFFNAKNIIIFAIVLTVLCCIGVGIVNYIKENKMSADNIRINLYYINNNTHTVEAEPRYIAKKNTDVEQLSLVADEFSLGSKVPNQLLQLPTGVKIKSVELNETTAEINLDKSYNDLTQDVKAMSIAAIVYTFTELDFVTDVIIDVDGKDIIPTDVDEMYSFNRENVRLSPEIDPEKKNWQMVILYFSDAQGRNLITEERSIEVKQSLTLEYQIVDQLIQGPESKNLKALVPSETKIKDIKTEDGICYVNLSGDFLSKKTGEASDNYLMVYSIVNSLTELDYVNKVQFLIEGERVEGLQGDFDFSKPFDRNQKLTNH